MPGGGFTPRFALDEDGLDVSLFDANRDADLIEADAGVAGGMFREEGDEFVAARDPFRDGAPPVVAEFDLALIEPDIVSAFFKVGLNEADEILVAVVTVTEEDAERGEGLLCDELVTAIFADVYPSLLAEDDVF